LILLYNKILNINQKAVIGTMVGTDDFDDDEP
jgi:hypothetical protein